MRIVDLAETIAPNVEQRVIGMRPSEKIHEILVTEEEARHTREFDDYYLIEPEFPFWSERIVIGGRRLREGFRYSSDNNHFMTSEELTKLVENQE
jgi:UDP-N-acetylglucosamine 4,6-dehydratase